MDIIDSKYWDESPLSELFDAVVFSCDVGSNEIFGAKSAGMKTIFTECLERKSESQRKKIIKYADYHIDNFDELLKYID